MQPAIVIVHRLPNWIRMRLSLPIRSEKDFYTMLNEQGGIQSFEYNPVIKSVLISFNHVHIDTEEVLIRSAIAYSQQYDMAPVRLYSDRPAKELPTLSYYSLAAIGLMAVVSTTGILLNTTLREVLKWTMVGTTIGAVMEHAYDEISERGAFDPEVVSVMYLFNSLNKGNLLSAAGITWIATFGRHLIHTSYDGAIIRVKKICDVTSDQCYYDVTVFENTDHKGMKFLKNSCPNS
ncbi:hypothetical protein J2Z22_002581 [Paenibacillus forsythiae]|uniref:Uncharacterized protein n=1 Tax=Paenibacillus forsythiae TaxID=365616 RepID=A0ABU3H897_9BACL|nr:hypothetical protein [Paenibacillus forsythiae]MDT3427047.1 hypothetical protein [Paenibacillus forsythiae]